MATAKKDTIYIDVEDDITAIIDKLQSAQTKIVAMVLPKRAQMLHSSVNMRLLKRAAETEGKRLVLITSEPTILALAGTVGAYTAKSLTSKPVIPKDASLDASESTMTISEDDLADAPLDSSKPIGELAGAAAVGAGVAVAASKAGEPETIELDNAASSEGEAAKKKPKEPKKDRKLKVPDFDRFRNKLFIFGALGVAALVLAFFTFFVWPRATITITTETNEVTTKFEFTANTAATTFDEAKKFLPAVSKELKQTATEKITPTGSKDIGNKAKGFVTLTNCNKDDETITMPAGSKLIVGSAVFVTDSNVSVPASNFTGGGVCKEDVDRDVDVTAELGGDVYNLSARGGYTAPGFPDISGFGSNMTGGTTNVVKVVSADDVEAARAKMSLRNTDDAKKQLETQLKAASLFPLSSTLVGVAGAPVSSPAVGEQATSATVTMEFAYSMLGVNEADFKKIVTTEQNKEIDTSKEKIYDDGISKAKISVISRAAPGDVKMNYNGTAIVGPILDADAIARDVAGKPGGETKQIIEARPGISSVEVRYDPFYVFNTPKKVNRITINFNVDGTTVQ
jgi:hypothetical protein